MTENIEGSREVIITLKPKKAMGWGRGEPREGKRHEGGVALLEMEAS